MGVGSGRCLEVEIARMGPGHRIERYFHRKPASSSKQEMRQWHLQLYDN
jgi:hypothetical protein